MTAQVSVETLSVVSHSNVPVITTELLANLYGTEAKHIQNNHSRNQDRFVAGKHYFKLEGAELKEFKDRPSLRGSVGKNARSLILWTERGAARHAKMLETDQAWEVFEKLEDCYFVCKNEITQPATPSYDSRILHYQRSGLTVASRPLADHEIILSMETCLQLFKRSGWLVIRPEELTEKLLSL